MSPLSQSQTGIYVTDINTHNEGNYNIDALYTLDAQIDPQRLRDALDAVVEAHPYLKARLTTNQAGEVMIQRQDEAPYHTPLQAIGDIAEVRPQLGRDFCLTPSGEDQLSDPLFRLAVYTTPQGNYLYVDFHHILMDGYAWTIFANDLQKAYAGKTLEPETWDGSQIAEAELAARETEAFDEAKAWYTQEFGAASEVDSMPLPDILGKEEAHYERQIVPIRVDKTALTQRCTTAGVTEATCFTAAFSLLLSKYSAADEVLYNTVFHARSDVRSRRAITMMVKTLPVYHRFAEGETVTDLLQQTAAQLKAARRNSLYSYTDIATDLGLQSSIDFAYQGRLHELVLTLDGREQQIESLITHTPGIPFLVMVMEDAAGYHLWLEYDGNKYSEAFIGIFAACYEQIMQALTKESLVSIIDCCNTDQLALLDSFNTPAAYPEETITEAFRRTAALYPDRTAAVYKDKRYTYRELDELTDRIAALIQSKVEPLAPQGERVPDLSGEKGAVISILIPRNEYMFILPLAAMKAGCAYQPLDPSYPQERLNFMVQDAEAALLIADPDLKDIINEYQGETLLTSDLTSLPPVGHPLPQGGKGEDLMILLYTSGSTGVPKGVMLEHRNVMAYVRWYQQQMGMTEESVTAAYASFGFDANMMDQYPTLTCGGTLHIIPEEIRLDLIALQDFMNTHGVTISFMTTQVAQQFILNAEHLTTLKHISLGGEKMMALTPPEGLKVHNLYGPTECSVAVTHHEVKDTNPTSQSVAPRAQPPYTSWIGTDTGYLLVHRVNSGYMVYRWDAATLIVLRRRPRYLWNMMVCAGTAPATSCAIAQMATSSLWAAKTDRSRYEVSASS